MSELADLIKSSILSLIVQANGVTHKGETNLSSCVRSLVLGYGQEGCTGRHVIPVDKLPTEKINISAVYMVPDDRCVDVGIYNDNGEYISVVVLIEALFGIPVTIFNVDTIETVEAPRPSPLFWYYSRLDGRLYGWNEDEGAWDRADGEDEDSIGTPGWVVKNDYAFYTWDDVGFRDLVIVGNGLQQSYDAMLKGSGAEYSYNVLQNKATVGIRQTVIADSMADSKIHLYYIESENDIFVYCDPEGIGECDWYSISSELSTENEKYTFQGCVEDMAEATETGYYAVGTPGWQKYMKPYGRLVITEANKSIDARDFSSVYFYSEKYGGEGVYE